MWENIYGAVPDDQLLSMALKEDGAGLLMCGGYFSFQGIDGKARWRRTPIEDVLPVTCLPWDDRVEIPEGTNAEIVLNEFKVSGLRLKLSKLGAVRGSAAVGVIIEREK